MMLLVLIVVFTLMLASSYVHQFIGTSGASIISRVMGLFLASVAVSSVLAGIVTFFEL